MGHSEIWDYFRKTDDDDGLKRARCLFCEQSLSYASTTHNLKSHLARIHPDEVTVSLTPSKRPTPRKNHSVIWQYFTKLKGGGPVAVCNLCSRPCSYKSTISNLRTHLARIHRNVYNDMVKEAQENSNDDEIYLEYADGDEDSNQSVSAPNVWSFFEQETGGRARCVVCRASLPHRACELRSHLKEKHPKLAQDIEGATEPEEDQNETYTEVVYLEDEVKKPPRRDSVRPSRPLKRSSTHSRKRRFSSSSSNDDDEQLEKFGTYVISLLKKMPRDVCTRLQMEIINLIMTRKLRIPEPEAKVVLDGVPVTVQSLQSGYVVTVPSGEKRELKTDPLNQEREKVQDASEA